MTYIKVLSDEGFWVEIAEKDLVDGQRVREYHSPEGLISDSGYVESVYSKSSTSLIEVIITDVTGAVKHNSDFTWVTVPLGEDVLVEFDLAISEDKVFNFFLSGLYGTPPDSFFAKVDKSGKGRVTLNFNAAGKYRYSDIEANMGVTPQKYSTKDILIEVGKATGDFAKGSGA